MMGGFDFEKHFKHEDIKVAKAELKCIEDLFNLAKLHIESGDFVRANRRMVELLNSIKRLEEMNISKRTDDEFKKSIGKLLARRAERQLEQFLMEQEIRMRLNE